uniref:PH domain-containing protein n=1 Tax=Octopus bimaculoides TaxID=37653 RepID=A0A0L8HYE9_OCTBM
MFFQRAPADKSYCITKELLMTERTFKKDLEVITQSFQNAVNSVMPDYLSHLMFSTLCPIYNFHCNFIRNIEQRIISWEGKYNTPVNPESQKIGNVLLELDTVLPIYRTYLDRLEEMLSELELTLKRNREFEQLYKEFEAEKTSVFFCIFQDNLQKLIELQRDLVGIDSLIHPDREFIREGCLQKFSRKGYQQRMFFLFSDMLIYTSRTATSLLQFKVHGQLPLRGMMVEESDISKVAVANSFTIYGGNKCILVAASSEEEKDKWIEDLNFSISMAKKQTDDRLKYGSIRSTTSEY